MSNDDERYYELGKSLKESKEKGGCRGWAWFFIIIVIVIFYMIVAE